MGPEEFDYTLPAELIAQYPLDRRDGSRLLVLSRVEGKLEHRRFTDIKEYLRKGDVLVLNDTGQNGHGPNGHGPDSHGLEVWECMARPSKGLKKGAEITFREGPLLDSGRSELSVRLLERGPQGIWACELRAEQDLTETIEAIGRMPLPPYIRREASELDKERYQTVFASKEGAVAAPTAGLHFTTGLIEEIKKMGVEVLYITLHTGPATFMPVRTKDIREHRLPREHFKIEPPVFEAVKCAKEQRRRVIAAGSTTTRAVESAFDYGSSGTRLEGETGLFIYPGFEFKVISGLLTNFHLPQSSLIMLVSAFAGRDNVMEAYREAVKQRYRFYSYGDAMLVI
jgi:S-adenosylmethionine:tRNA ribosyltransferase-isomerase